MLTAVVLTKNEENNIVSCLFSLNFCDEILLIDDNSSDNTVKLAQKFGSKIYKNKLKNYSSQRNFGLSKPKGEWVLFVDADERVSKKLASEIIKKTKNTKISGYFINRQDIFLGKTIRGGEHGKAKILRLGKKKAGKWKRGVHEYWNIKNKTATLKNPLIHHKNNLNSQVKKINFYTPLHSAENQSEGKNSSITKIIFYPPLKFCKNFLLKKGYKDQTHGFILAMLLSFHSFLSWSHQWLKSNKN